MSRHVAANWASRRRRADDVDLMGREALQRCLGGLGSPVSATLGRAKDAFRNYGRIVTWTPGSRTSAPTALMS